MNLAVLRNNVAVGGVRNIQIDQNLQGTGSARIDCVLPSCKQLLANPTFNANLNNWTFSTTQAGLFAASVNNASRTGAGCLLIESVAGQTLAASTYAPARMASDPVPASADQPFYAEVWAEVALAGMPAGLTANAALYAITTYSDASADAILLQNTAASTWTKLSGSFTPIKALGKTPVSVRIYCQIDFQTGANPVTFNGTTVDASIRFDDAILRHDDINTVSPFDEVVVLQPAFDSSAATYTTLDDKGNPAVQAAFSAGEIVPANGALQRSVSVPVTAMPLAQLEAALQKLFMRNNRLVGFSTPAGITVTFRMELDVTHTGSPPVKSFGPGLNLVSSGGYKDEKYIFSLLLGAPSGPPASASLIFTITVQNTNGAAYTLPAGPTWTISNINFGIPQFGGFINSLAVKDLADAYNGANVFASFLCRNYKVLADTALITGTFTATGDGAIVDSITAGIFNTGNIQTYKTLTVSYSNQTVSSIMDQLARTSGAVWFVDANNAVNYVLPSAIATPAPLILDADAPDGITSLGFLNLSEWSQEFFTPCNYVVVRGINAGTPFFETRQDAASQTKYGRTLKAFIQDDTLSTTAQADAVGDAWLAKNADPKDRLSLKVYVDGFAVGQVVKINKANFGWQQKQFTIQSISLRQIYTATDGFRREYILTLGDVRPDLVAFLKSVVPPGAPAN